MGKERRAEVTVVQCSGVLLVLSANIHVHYKRQTNDTYARISEDSGALRRVRWAADWSYQKPAAVRILR